MEPHISTTSSAKVRSAWSSSVIIRVTDNLSRSHDRFDSGDDSVQVVKMSVNVANRLFQYYTHKQSTYDKTPWLFPFTKMSSNMVNSLTPGVMSLSMIIKVNVVLTFSDHDISTTCAEVIIKIKVKISN